jgi:hypothetical protein
VETLRLVRSLASASNHWDAFCSLTHGGVGFGGLIRVWVFGCFPGGDGCGGEFFGMDDGWVLITNW